MTKNDKEVLRVWIDNGYYFLTDREVGCKECEENKKDWDKAKELLNKLCKPRKKWKTLEELGFELVNTTDSYLNFSKPHGEYKSRILQLIIWKEDKTYTYKDYARRTEGDWSYDESATEPINQELNKAVELKMIELGLWVE